MIALGPAGALKRVGAEGNEQSWQETSKKGHGGDPGDWNIVDDIDGVGNAGNRRIGLRLNAQVVAAGRDARDHDGIVLIAFTPGTVAAVAGVVAHFAAKVPGLSGVLIDERIVQINP